MKEHQQQKRTLQKSSQPHSKRTTVWSQSLKNDTQGCLWSCRDMYFILCLHLQISSELLLSWILEKGKYQQILNGAYQHFPYNLLHIPLTPMFLQCLGEMLGSKIRENKERSEARNKQWNKTSTPKTFWWNSSVNHVHGYSKVKTAFFFTST